MGVDYSPVLYVGKEFGDSSEAQDFYEQFFALSESDYEYIEDNGFSEFCCNLKNGLSGETLNCYSGYGFVLGIDIGSSVRNHECFAESVGDAIIKWEELFKDEPFYIVHAVRVW